MNTERSILENLKRAHPSLMTTAALWSEVFLDEARTSYSGFKTALHELQVKGQIVVITGEDREKAKITDAGLARLME